MEDSEVFKLFAIVPGDSKMISVDPLTFEIPGKYRELLLLYIYVTILYFLLLILILTRTERIKLQRTVFPVFPGSVFRVVNKNEVENCIDGVEAKRITGFS